MFSFYDPATYQGFGQYEPNPICASRDIRLLLHIRDHNTNEGRRWSQAQLHKYGFTTSRPRPIIRYVSPGDFYDIERPIRFKSRPSFPVTVQGVTAAGNTIRLRARILNPVGLSADMVQF